MSHITGIRSATGARAEGWFIGLPLTPRTLLDSPLDFVYRRLIQCGRLAESLGAGVVGLGAFTKIVGDRGITAENNHRQTMTTANINTEEIDRHKKTTKTDAPSKRAETKDMERTSPNSKHTVD